MSAAKRSRSGQGTVPSSASPLPASKRQKVSQGGHALSKKSGLEFLVDENARAGKNLKAELTNGLAASRASRTSQTRHHIAPDASEDELDDHSVENVVSNGSKKTSRTTDKQSKASRAKKHKSAVIDISSGEESSELDSVDAASIAADTTKESPQGIHEGEEGTISTNGVKVKSQTQTTDLDDTEEPAFGELLARHAGQINVGESLLNGGDRHIVLASGEQNLDGLSSATLGTVLTQALKTNDKEQLETCFKVGDPERIRATIQRLNSQHVATLLQRISERIYSRPGRTGNLFVWIQWSLVVHGGYLATHTEVMKKLKALSRVIKERARGLQPLLHLKGKIDMLSAQLDLRRNLQQRSMLTNLGDQDNEDGVVYIEGQDDDWSDDEDLAVTEGRRKAITDVASRRAHPEVGSDSDEAHDPLANGVTNGLDNESEDDDGDDDADDSDGMLDIEADETSDDDGSDVTGEDSDSAVDSMDEDDSDEENESDNEVVKQPKLYTLNRRR